MATVPPFSELIAATTTSAVHLEMRDAYTGYKAVIRKPEGTPLPRYGRTPAELLESIRQVGCRA